MESEKDDLRTQCHQQPTTQLLDHQMNRLKVEQIKGSTQERSYTVKQDEFIEEKQLNLNFLAADCDQINTLEQTRVKNPSQSHFINQNQQASCQINKLYVQQSQITPSAIIQSQIENKMVVYNDQPQRIKQFCPQYSSKTIKLSQKQDQAEQDKFYYENFKLILTEPITSMDSNITFRLDNIKYCVGVGVALKQIVQKHDYDYKSTTTLQMGHGLYIVTSQGYSWSHSEENSDDFFRQGFNSLYSGVNIDVKFQGQNLSFKWKKGSFTMELPSRVRQKYTLCFCAYLHQKTDCISIVP